MAVLWLAPAAFANSPTATNDLGIILPNQPVTIPVLTNDSDNGTNQLAVLKVTTPPNGSVSLNSNSVPLNPELARLFAFATLQMSNNVTQIADTNAYPRSTLPSGLWLTMPASDWITGFFPGAMWYLYEQSGDLNFRTWAEKWTAGLASQQNVTDTDDLGFMLNNSFGNGYRLTGNPTYEPILVQAARSVVTNRYNSVVGCIGDNQGGNLFVIIDSMMNLELLFHAAALSGDHSLYVKAYNHAVQTMTNHVRADGSTYQVVNYNRTTGAVVNKTTRDGASATSTWARGQSWALYGFTMAYRETGDNRFLQTAQRTADYYIANLPSDYVPYWDFQAPGIPNAPRDSSSAAIALSGLLELSQAATNLQDSARYWKAASQIFGSLSSTNYLAQGSHSSGILLHGTGEGPLSSQPETNVSLIYGDYYFIEALRRYTQVYGQTTLTYAPNTNFQGNNTFKYLLCDSAGACATGMVTVAVEPAITALISSQTAPPAASLSFLTTTGRQYFVQYRDDLAATSWNILATNVIGTGSATSVADTNVAPSRFYRVGVRLP